MYLGRTSPRFAYSFLIQLLIQLCCLSLAAQTFEIGQPGQNSGQATRSKGGKTGQSTSSSSGDQLGWGSNIEVARQARAAEMALKKGDYNTAFNYAERAANAAPQDAHLWFLLGYTARLTGRLQQAVDAFQHGLRNNPSSVDGLSGLAQTYAKMGRADEAKRLLMQVIAADPKRVNELLAVGELLLQSGDPQRAVGLLNRVEAMQPSSHAELLLALAYSRLKQPEQAKLFLNRARQRAPDNPEVLRALAGYYREIKNYPAAIQILQSVPAKSADVIAELAYTYSLAGQKKEAAETYAKAAAAAPKQISLQLAAAQAELNLGVMDKAENYLTRAAAVDPNHYRVHAMRAEIARQTGRKSEAIEQYNAALRTFPESPSEGLLYPIQLHMTLAELYRENGDQASARQQVELAQSQIHKLQVQDSSKAQFFGLRAAVRSGMNDLTGAQADIEQAVKADPENVNYLLQYGNILWRLKRAQDAFSKYTAALKLDPNNRFALSSLGYLSREFGDQKAAESYFQQFAAAYPRDAAAFLALGDLYTARRDFLQAEVAYRKGYELASRNPLIVAGGANAAIEAHNLDLAGQWLQRANDEMNQEPHLMRERERYLRFAGKYSESAELGRQVIQKLPRDRDAIVYLGYDLLHLGRYDELLALTSQYENVLPKEADLPLLAGYVHKGSELLNQALDDFTLTLKRNPETVTAYVNRGYVLNDLQNPEAAIMDFDAALKREPNNGEAELGLSFSHLELHHGKPALMHVERAEKQLGESGTTHSVRATAYWQLGMLTNAKDEFRVALQYAPKDLTLRLALAQTLYHLHHYSEAIDELDTALAISPDDPLIYSSLAHAYARLHRRDDTLRYVEAAEKQATNESDVLLNTGEAFLILGDRDAAMDRFERALEAPDADRVQARLAIAKLMFRGGRWEDTRQQVALAFAESRIGDASPVTVEQYLQAADLFLNMHDFDMAEKLFRRAQDAGGADQVIAIGLANVYLAKGDTAEAEALLASLGSPADYDQNYGYLMARAGVFGQKHENLLAMSTFARASLVAGDEDEAQRRLLDLAAQEGLRINERFSIRTDFSVAPVYEDETIYILDARLRGISNPALLPSPRSSLETTWTSASRIHQPGLPMISTLIQVRNARGSILLPSEDQVLKRDTWDYTFNGAVNPVLRFGRNHLILNTGLQFTVRRDSLSPVDMNQNLFRQFVYADTSSLFNWLSVRGEIIHEGGPFTQKSLYSNELTGKLEFRVGRPWGHTALITGYAARDLTFHPRVLQWFSTSTYMGLEQKFGSKLKVRELGEYVRAYRVQDTMGVSAQMMRPAAEVRYEPNRQWSLEGKFAFSRGMGMHDYDNIRGGIFVSYVKGLRRTMDDGSGPVSIEYPLRFSAGLERETFFNFNGRSDQAAFRPVFRLTLF